MSLTSAQSRRCKLTPILSDSYIIDLQQRIERWERSKSTNEPSRESIEAANLADKVESGLLSPCSLP